MMCSNCAGTGTKLNSQVYVEWANHSSGTLSLTTICECQTKTTTGGVGAAVELDTSSSDQPNDHKRIVRIFTS